MIISALSSVGFVAVMLPGPVSAAEIHLAAQLDGSASYSAATGRSEYDKDANDREVEVTVSHILRLADKTVTVFVGGHKVGTMLVSSTGRAHREWDTDDGQSVPVATVGTTVRVRTANDTLVASGKYHVESDD